MHKPSNNELPIWNMVQFRTDKKAMKLISTVNARVELVRIYTSFELISLVTIVFIVEGILSQALL